MEGARDGRHVPPGGAVGADLQPRLAVGPQEGQHAWRHAKGRRADRDLVSACFLRLLHPNHGCCLLLPASSGGTVLPSRHTHHSPADLQYMQTPIGPQAPTAHPPAHPPTHRSLCVLQQRTDPPPRSTARRCRGGSAGGGEVSGRGGMEGTAKQPGRPNLEQPHPSSCACAALPHHNPHLQPTNADTQLPDNTPLPPTHTHAHPPTCSAAAAGRAWGG